jgi:ATP-dependent DNA helicase RecQ
MSGCAAAFPTYTGWTDEEDRRLREGFEQGRKINALAAAHRRSEGGIRSRLVRLGLL